MPHFRKVKIESLVELEWSIVHITFAIDKLFYIQEVGDSPPIKAILHAVDWSNVKGVIHSLLGNLGEIKLCKSMGKSSKGTKSSSESTQQSVWISQTVDDTKQILHFPKVPFGLSISPKELNMLKAIYHSIVTQ